MPKKVVSGNYAAAYAAKHARVEVVAAYPKHSMEEPLLC